MNTSDDRQASQPNNYPQRSSISSWRDAAGKQGLPLLVLLPLLLGCALLAACGSSSSGNSGPATSSTPASGTVSTTSGSGAVSTTASGGPVTVTVQANDFLFKFSRMTVPAGTVHFVLENQSKTYQHELWVYPQTQPKLTAMLAAEDAGQTVNMPDYIQGAAGHVGPLDPGATASFDVTLQPGTYEMSCFVTTSIAGKTMVHYEMGMHGLLTVQ